MFDRWIERLLEAAHAEGKFDNLSGQGKPLQLEGNENDPEWAAQHLMKQNEARPRWLEEDLAIRAALQTALNELNRTADYVRQHPQHVAEWGRAAERFRAQATDLNRRIRDYNLSTPLERLQRPRIDVEGEIERARPWVAGTGSQ